MDFTREPILETIITPKEGYKLVIRSSKNAGQEEYFVDAVEIVAFGHALFFRSLERPKAFVVPVSDYEVLEVREARMVLKNAGLDRSIKIGGGREGNLKAHRENDKTDIPIEEHESEQEDVVPQAEVPASAEVRPDTRVDKKRDRRRHYRKRKGRDEVKEEVVEPVLPALEEEKISLPVPEQNIELAAEGAVSLTPTILSSLLQPPPTLISETINRYRQNELFKGAFYLTEDEQYKPHDKVQELLNEEDEEESIPELKEPTFLPEAHSVEEMISTDESESFAEHKEEDFFEQNEFDLERIHSDEQQEENDFLSEDEQQTTEECMTDFDLPIETENNIETQQEEFVENEQSFESSVENEKQDEPIDEPVLENEEQEDFSSHFSHEEEKITEAALPLYAEEDADEAPVQPTEDLEDKKVVEEKNLTQHDEHST